MSEAQTKSSPLIASLLDRLRSPEFLRFLKFGTVGGSGVFVNMGFLWLGKNYFFAGLPYATAVAWAGFVAIAISILTNFLLNDIWTWGDREKRGVSHFFMRMAKYFMVASIAGVVQWGTLQGLVHVGLHYLLANMIGIGLGIVINYAANNWWTYRVNASSS